MGKITNVVPSMYKGGMFDHIGFGFFRYSTDEKWLVPDFEKMLYDNALASLSYAGKVLKNNTYIDVANLAVLEDYAFFVLGLIELYEACFDIRYLEKALELNNQMIELFMDEKDGGFYLLCITFGNDVKSGRQKRSIYDILIFRHPKK